MKEITIPPPTPLETFDGEPFRNEKGEPEPPMPFARYARQLLRVAQFTEGLDAIDATELVLKVKRKIDEANGKLHLEDEEHKRLLAALKGTRPQADFAACIYPHIAAIRDARSFVAPVSELEK